jgi:hypothetical protein
VKIPTQVSEQRWLIALSDLKQQKGQIILDSTAKGLLSAAATPALLRSVYR